MRTDKILLQKNFRSSDIKIQLNQISNRKIDPTIESEIEVQWQKTINEYNAADKKLWNGNSYRLDSFLLQENELVLTLSFIDYRTRRGLGKSDKLATLGDDYLPKGLFCGALICTTDNYFVFGKRKGLVSDDIKVDLVGGVLLRDEVQIKTANDLQTALFIELKEELNIEPSHVESCTLNMLLLTQHYNAGLVYTLQLTLSQKQVVEYFTKNNDAEFVELIFIKKTDIITFLKKQKGYLPLLVSTFQITF